MKYSPKHNSKKAALLAYIFKVQPTIDGLFKDDQVVKFFGPTFLRRVVREHLKANHITKMVPILPASKNRGDMRLSVTQYGVIEYNFPNEVTKTIVNRVKPRTNDNILDLAT